MSHHPASDGIDYAALVIPSGTPDRITATSFTPDLRCSMRDGVELGADLHCPAAA